MYIGIDIGASNIRIASFKGFNAESFRAEREFPSEVKFPVHQNFEISLQRINNGINKLLGQDKVKGIGIAVPGVINTKKKWIEKSANLPLWEKKPLGMLLEDKFNTKVIIHNDLVAPSVCEATHGFGQTYAKFVYFVWGTGIGGAYIEKAKNKIKIHTMEPGHQIIVKNGLRCGCGQNGCLEAYIGGRSLEKRFGLNFYKTMSDKQWLEVASQASQGVINTLMHFPVRLIVFGGGVVLNHPQLLDLIEQKLEENLKVYKKPKISLSKYKEKSALLGTCMYFKTDLIE